MNKVKMKKQKHNPLLKRARAKDRAEEKDKERKVKRNNQ